MSALTRLPAWKALQKHHKDVSPVHLRDLFREDPKRFERFSASCGDLLLDYSKNRITPKTLTLLLALAEEVKLKEWTERMFSGEAINFTEGRAVLHTALRNRSKKAVKVDGKDVMTELSR